MTVIRNRALFIPLGRMRAVLFDLDGTLADTAPSLAVAANKMRRARGMAALPLEQLHPYASAGVCSLLNAALGIKLTDADFPSFNQEFLTNYAADLSSATALFPSIDLILAALSSRCIPWGIVTNKIARFTEPLTAQLGLASAASCIVSGDTTPHPKPHPAPLLHAAGQLGIAPSKVVYVGDNLRDVQAGQSAGMLTVAVAYGYVDAYPHISEWGADYVVDSPIALHTLLVPERKDQALA